MSVVLGCLLALGLLLALSPFLWPRDTGSRREKSALSALLRVRLAQAGMPRASVAAFVVVSCLAALVGAALVFAFVPVAALAVAAALTAFVLPFAVVTWRANARRRANRVVWPDVVDHLVSAVRSGLALPDSVMALAHTGPAFARGAFARFERQYRRTGNFALCLDELKAALADPVSDRILETLRMSREVGGSELTTVLRNLAAYLRQDAAIRAEVEARQSWVMNAAKLGVAAPWVILLLLASRPEAAAAYNTTAGIGLIVGGLVVSVLAYRLMQQLGRMPEERRWFQ
ncbi:type II secretion system F family protein [Parafrigoribacterium soli]|uniref:type II secretion system F family protein n=1 Tax=Parafrigoribacterium soli TaxID=3144663 RepID=UPI0032EF70A7